MPTRKSQWSFDKTKRVWLGHFHSKQTSNGRATRRQIATEKQCPVEDYEYLLSKWRIKLHSIELEGKGISTPRLKTALEDWLKYVKRYRDMKTMKLYKRTANRLLEAMGNIDISTIGFSHTDDFANLLRTKYKNGPETQRSICKEAKVFFGFMVDREILYKKPRFPKIIVTKKEMRTYTEEQLFLIRQRINFMVQRSNGSDVFLRTQLRVITMAMHTGMRGGEIRNLLIDNISIKKRCIYLRENKDWRIKGRREDKPIPVNETLFTFLVADLRHRSPSEVWYLDNGTGNITYSQSCDMAKAIRSHGIAIGMNPNEMPKPIHGIRACVAKMCNDKGRDIVSIQKLLRHEDITTTRKYINAENSDLKSSVDVLEYTALNC